MTADDDFLIQNRYAMLALLQRARPLYEQATRCYQFNPNSYTHDALNALGLFVRDV
jgi:hypothetical protein